MRPGQRRADIGLVLGEHLPLYRGPVMAYWFSSSITFGEGLQRALADQRLVIDALQGRLLVTKSNGYLTNGAAAQGDVQTQRHFGGCLLVGMICFFQVRHRGAL